MSWKILLKKDKYEKEVEESIRGIDRELFGARRKEQEEWEKEYGPEYGGQCKKCGNVFDELGNMEDIDGKRFCDNCANKIKEEKREKLKDENEKNNSSKKE